jgi:hypothetical protein
MKRASSRQGRSSRKETGSDVIINIINSLNKTIHFQMYFNTDEYISCFPSYLCPQSISSQDSIYRNTAGDRWLLSR